MILALVVGCSTPGEGLERSPEVRSTRPLPDSASSRATLDELATVDRSSAALPRYRRDAFGTAWSDVDGNGCNQRDDVLLRDALPGSVRTAPQGRCEHDVLAGRWQDPYTGRMLALDDLKDPAQAQAVQIDHVVALSEAWRSGAWAWDDETRVAFANSWDVLVAADGPTNASKSDHDPAAWRPGKVHQCDYARRWIAVKSAWSLGVDPSERRALTEMLDVCP